MNSQFREELKEEVVSPLHDALLRYVMDRLTSSRAHMSKYYATWDALDTAYKAQTTPDKEDKELEKQGLPSKFALPLTYAQLQTFIAFSFLLLRQRSRFYEFTPTGGEDRPWRECAELLVQRDLCVSEDARLLWNFLLDLSRFGIAVQKDEWVTQKMYIEETQEMPPVTLPDGRVLSQGETVTKDVEVVTFEGNSLAYISPYRFFPDPSYALPEWKKGSFVAVEDEFGREYLRQLEAQGVCQGVQYINDFSSVEEKYKSTRKNMRMAFKWDGDNVTCGPVSVSIVLLDLIPNDIFIDVGNGRKSLGPEKHVVRVLVWIANDGRIIRCEKFNALHGQWPFTVGMFSPDVHDTVDMGSLAKSMDRIQGVISWFINARIAAVTRTIDNQLVVDPSGVELASIQQRSRAILLKKSAARTDVRKYIQQLQVQDTTTGHVADAQNLMGVMQLITGVNDAAMGQAQTGRRSATEMRSVLQGAASRMRLILDVLWETSFVPRGNRLLLNHRQAVSLETFVKVCGEDKQGYYPVFKASPRALVGSYDLFAYDGTLPSEKNFLAQSLQELLLMVLQNPMVAQVFNIDPNKLLKEIYQLRGVGSLTGFSYEQIPDIAGQLAAAEPAEPQSVGGAGPTGPSIPSV